MPGTLIATQGDENWVFSADGAYIYVAGNDGYLRVFDARTGESVYSVDLGSNLGAISLSPDGTRLAVVEEVPENVRQFQSWTENSADVSLYIVDLSTFGAQELTFHVTAEGYTFADVTWSDNDTLQLSQNILPGWSGWAPLATIELATGALTEHSSYYSGLGTSASLLTIPDSNTVLLGQLGLSSAQYFLIGPDGNALTNNGVYNNDVYGYAGGIEAASGTTASDRIVIVTGGGAHLYDGTMAYIGNLASLYPNLGNAAGVTFSADGQRLFFLDSANQAVVVLDAYNYSLVATVQLPGVIFETLKWSEEIVVAPDGNGIYYNTSSGIAYVSVDLPDLGTDGADQLSGTAGDDIIDGRAGADLISGLAGDDWLIGGAGNDTLNGGDGFDIASYETATTGVSVDLGIAVAQATGGADVDTLISIEGLSGSIFNDTLTGNATDNLLLGYDGNDTLRGFAGDDDLYGESGNDQLLGGSGDDWLYGDSGNDLLDGGTGADRLEGGDGNDTYVVDDAGDIVLETATGGYDTMRVSNFSATIASSVEALIITSGAVNATGNFVANNLTGSDQANVLSGLGGNDTLTGNLGNDTFQDTTSGLNGDTITDFSVGDRIVFTDATLAGFTFNLSGNTLTYAGGSLTLTAPFSGTLVASAAAAGGVQIAIQPAYDARGDFNGNGRSDFLLRADSGWLTQWTSNANGSFTNNAANVSILFSNDWHVQGIGDFNGDGKDDFLLRNDSGWLTQWLGSPTGGFTNNGANVSILFTTDWKIAGVGDFNGDGRDDFLLRSDAGWLTEWIGNPNGSFTNNGPNVSVFFTTDWNVVGTGDFNGDGKDDFLLRNSAGWLTEWTGTENGNFANNGANVSLFFTSDWHMVGTGDFNGDGKDDFLLRNDAGWLTEWLGTATGGFTNNGANVSLFFTNDWHVASIGDFNGDGRDDFLLRNDAGWLTQWTGNANGSFTNNGANVSQFFTTDWHVQAPDLL